MKKDDISYRVPGTFEEQRFEKLHNVVFNSPEQASKIVAAEIAALIKEKNSKAEKCVLGLSTGSSPISVYKELVRLHKNEGLTFRNVVTFNLDEYSDINKDDINSYHFYMYENLFNKIDILEGNINIPKSNLNKKSIRSYCTKYEKKIIDLGGIDLQLLGIGRTGHIGFNEPGSHINSQTRFVSLDHITRSDAARAFNGIENVPETAITMGIKTILDAKRILLLAWGINKSEIIQKTIEGEVSSILPATYLQNHNNSSIIIDKEAASFMTRINTPWLIKSCEWDKPLKLKAISWLCKKTNKSILKLTEEDYNRNGMSELLAIEGNYYDLNIKMFNHFQNKITGWPGGKPNSDDSKRPERSEPSKKNCLIFSPHPDDDVISMGGTFDRLVTQGHEVHVAYQTSGNLAVSDEDALKFIEVISDLKEDTQKKYNQLKKEIINKDSSSIDSPQLRQLKGFIRKRESLAATRFIGIPDKNVHFLNLPFYETGMARKLSPTDSDRKILNSLIEKIKPHQIYAAGDLADPHGTHRICLNLIYDSLEELKSKPFMKNCWVWLYRGAWQEWEVHEIDMAVPMSPEQVLKKRKSIFMHQSQKDGAMFVGDDTREFWIRAEDRNKKSAEIYKKMGLADYQAMEFFKRYFF